MFKLSIFDDSILIATITSIDGNIYIFARSSREWSDMRRLIDSGYEVNKQDEKFLEHVANRAHSHNYSTELINKD